MSAISPPTTRKKVQCLGCGQTNDYRTGLSRLVLAGWPRCCGQAMFLVDAADMDFTAVAAPVTHLAQRRAVRRTRSGSFEIALRARPGGWELPVAAVDVSAAGLGVVLADDLPLGALVQLDLASPSGGLRLPAEVRWCVPVGDGTFQAGLQFCRRLSAVELAGLAPEVPTSSPAHSS